MAQLKDLIVTGATRLIGDVAANKIQTTSIVAPTVAGGSTYSAGSNGQILVSNGSSVYWNNGVLSSGSAGYAASAAQATHAASANYSMSAAQATHAASSQYAINAASAQYARNAASAGYAASAAQATHAASAQYAINSASAGYAASAAQATHAASAQYAISAASAGYAASAAQATHAASAQYAINAASAQYARNAASAQYARNAASAGYATSAANATYAASAGSSTEAVHAVTAEYAASAGYALTADTSVSSGSAGYAASAAQATHSASATYALSAASAGYSASAANATYAASAGKLGSSNVGNYLNPIYLSSGTATASKGNTIPFIVGTGTTAGTWLGTLDGLTEYTDGLLILYKSPVAGANTTTLNLNSLGAKTVYINNTTKLTTHFPANQPILLTYSSSQNSGCWMCLDDYWTNSNTIPAAYCGTAAATAAKAASCDYWTATANSYLHFDIRYANSVAGAITMNVNSTGAKPVYINGAASSDSNYTLPAGSYIAFYDGTNFQFRTDGYLPGLGIIGKSGSAGYAASAAQATHAASAGYSVSAAQATHAASAQYSINAASAQYARNAASAGYAVSAAQATHAASANYSMSAAQATHAASANYSMSAARATYAAQAAITTTAGGVAYYSDTAGTFANDADFLWDATNNKLTAAKLNGYVMAGQASGSTLGIAATAEGLNTISSSTASHAEGASAAAVEQAAHAEGFTTTASGFASHAEGYQTIATTTASHAEGYSTGAVGPYAHAEGYSTTASGQYSHAEGMHAIANGIASHAEGMSTFAGLLQSHAEGCSTTAYGARSHAEGFRTVTIGQYSHAEGHTTIANGDAQHVSGLYNIADSTSLEIIGNGSDDDNRSNARTLSRTGDEWLAGGISAAKFIGTTTAAYGSILPASGVEGQIFFQVSSGDIYEIPTGGSTGQALIKSSSADRAVTWGDVGGKQTPASTKFYPSGSTSTTTNTDDAVFNTNVYVQSNVLYGACWNDYAEFRQLREDIPIPYGYCVCENGDDTLSLSIERMQPAPAIVSDTFGYAIGVTDKAQVPIAVSGRVLVYPYENRNNYKPGDCVCAGPEGKVCIMTREEIKEYPDRIVGIVSAIPQYTVWGQNDIAVDDRIWVKVK